MARKTAKFNHGGAAKLPNDKPVVYRIQTESGKTNYVGTAKRGRVQERIQEHLDAGNIPGAKVQVNRCPAFKRRRELRRGSLLAPSRSTTKKGNEAPTMGCTAHGTRCPVSEPVTPDVRHLQITA